MSQTRSTTTNVESGVRELLALGRKNPLVAIRFFRKFWLFYLSSVTGDRISGGQRGYARFVILGRYRSGSNMVRGSLMAHSRIVAFGDVFRTPQQPSFGMPFYRTTRAGLRLFQDDPVSFLERRVYCGMPRRVAAVGLKLLYTQRRNDPWMRVRDALARSADIRAIHVKRDNTLRAHLSNVQRLRHGRWKDVSGSAEQLPPVELSYEDCLEAFATTRAWEEEHDRLFPSDRRVDVIYERLCADYAAEVRRVTDFLGLPFEPVRPLTYKQSRSRLSDAIANYGELRERFRHSPWERFFEDD